MALLQYRDVSKKYGTFSALENLNLDINSGRIIGLLGPNGSGKTTLIKMTSGILTPTTGTITVNGHPIGVESKKLVSYLPERTYLDETLTVEKTLDYFADFYGDFDKVKAKELLERLNVQLTSKLKTLSKGTKEKVQLCLVMSRRASLYLLDEPIAGVDPAARDYILDTILSNYAENATVIISTHLISDIERVLDDVIFLSYGKVILTSTVDGVLQSHGKTVDQLFREVFKC